MSLETISAEATETNGAVLKLQHTQIMDQIRAYVHETFREKKIAGAKQTAELEKWLDTQKANPEDIKSLSDFYHGYLRDQLASGRSLHRRFHADISRAAQNKWISKASQEKWIRRFENPSASYKDREKWVMEDMPEMMERWKAAAEERQKLSGNPAFKALAAERPELADLLSEERFLNLHYEKRKDLLASARAAMLSSEKGQDTMHTAARTKLLHAVNAGILSASKVGMWLERIFKSGASPQKIDAFINGSDTTSLDALMQNWAQVTQRFDAVEKKFKERWEGTGIRGFHMLTKNQFLGLHYAQRLQFVQQAEDRLDGANDVDTEAPILLKIRHAMDTKDWEHAGDLIGTAKTTLRSEKDFARLKSMESYVRQFSGKNQEIKKRDANVTEAKNRIDSLMTEIMENHSEVEPMVNRLMRGPNANRSIHQFRWIVYNNDWCTTHGYLNDEIARRGASKENEQATKERGDRGEDIGRHDVASHSTDGKQHIRKTEHSTHRATYRHVNVSSGGATNQTAEWLEHEQNPRVLYWTTFCAHENGNPKGHNWHRDLFVRLTELRSHARTLKNAGFMYAGQGHSLIGLN